MAKKDLVGLSGTPWHVGYLKKEEDDPRRDKRNCCTKCRNAFDGEPDTPVHAEFIFVPSRYTW